jgi:uncharacterized repeat protein (TIGR01451 family)
VKNRKALLLLAIILTIVPVAFAGTPTFDVGVTKTGPSTINRGADIPYTVQVTNVGNTAATTVQLTDALPPGMTFTSLSQSGPVFTCSTPPVGSNGTVSCSIATLAAGATTTFTIVGTVSSSAPGGSTVSNTASVTTTSPDSNNTNNSQTSTATVTSESDLAVTKSAPATASAGSDVTYSIQVMNNGPDAAATVSLTDPLPPGMTFVSETQNSGPAFSCSNPAPATNGTITCTIASLAAGASADFTFAANIPPQTPPGTTFTNTATVSAATQDSNDENNASTGATTVPTPSADLIVQKSGPASALADTDVVYSITLINGGPDAAASVVLSDTLPGSMTFVAFTQNSGPAFDCTSQPAVGSGGTVTCTIASLASGTTSTFTLTGHIPPATASGTTFTNVATANSIAEPVPTADPNLNNNTAQTSLTVASSDMMITKTGPGTATAGGTIAWTITVTNNGPDAEQNPSFTDTLPAGTTFNSLVQNTGSTANCGTPAPNNPGTVNCSFSPFISGESAQFTLTANISPSFTGTLNNTATATGANADPNTNNNSQTASATVSGSADLTINKSGPASANAGTNITYTVTLTNSGPSAAASVSLTDAVPANTTFVSESQTAGPTFSCSAPAPGGTGTITCTIGSFPVGSATFSITVHINPGATGSVTNTANVSTPTADPNPNGNNPTAITTVTSSADLSVVKTAASAVQAGNNVTYHIVVTNNGPSDATAVNMSDTLPPNATFVSETQTGGPSFTCLNPAVGGTGTVSCSIATLTSGTIATFDIVANVAAATPAGPSSNTAIVTSSSDPNSSNNSSTAVTQVGASLADLAITKTPAPGPYGTGQPLTYTIVVSNGGPAAAASVTVTDTLPAGTTLQSSTPAGACSGTTVVTCNAGTLANGASATFTLTITLPSTPGAITNTAVASASAANPDPNLGNNTATSTITVIPAANIPMVSPLSMLLLCIALAVAGAFVLKS